MGKRACERSRLIRICNARATGIRTAPAANAEFHPHFLVLCREVLKAPMPPTSMSSPLQTAVRTDAFDCQRSRHHPCAGFGATNVIDSHVAAWCPLHLRVHDYPLEPSPQRIVMPHSLKQNRFKDNATFIWLRSGTQLHPKDILQQACMRQIFLSQRLPLWQFEQARSG